MISTARASEIRARTVAGACVVPKIGDAISKPLVRVNTRVKIEEFLDVQQGQCVHKD